MIVKKKGKYKTIKPIVCRNSISVTTVPVGVIIEITQIHNERVFSPELMDWHNWDMPVIEINGV